MHLPNRAEAVRSGLVEPTVDNMLKITNDGRKCALDQRLLNDMLPDEADSKVIPVCAKNAYDIWERNGRTEINAAYLLRFVHAEE